MLHKKAEVECVKVKGDFLDRGPLIKFINSCEVNASPLELFEFLSDASNWQSLQICLKLNGPGNNSFLK
jgi:hypothetical protein